MNDALRAKSSPLPATTNTRALPPPLSTTPCLVCTETANVRPEWTPPPGLDQDLYQFRCINLHLTYRTARHHKVTNETLALV